MKFNRKIELTGDCGTKVEVDVSDLNLTGDQSSALNKLVASGGLDSLNQDEKDLLKDIKARVGTGTPGELAQAIIVRFDLEWVSIN